MVTACEQRGIPDDGGSNWLEEYTLGAPECQRVFHNACCSPIVFMAVWAEDLSKLGKPDLEECTELILWHLRRLTPLKSSKWTLG